MIVGLSQNYIQTQTIGTLTLMVLPYLFIFSALVNLSPELNPFFIYPEIRNFNYSISRENVHLKSISNRVYKYKNAKFWNES